MRSGPALLAVLALAACRVEAPEPQAAAAPRFVPDEELPAPDEVPAFLREAAAPAPAPASPAAPEVDPAGIDPVPGPARPPDDLASLLGQVEIGGEGEDGGEGEAYIAASSDGLADPDPAPAVPVPQEVPAGSAETARGGEAAAPPARRDPCEPIRAAIEARRGFVGRTAAERDRYGYVENADDATALRLLESLRRCREFPDDPDCRTQPMEIDAGDVPTAVERKPGELSADEKDPDEIVHDPELIRLTRDLATCERRNTPQPLLQR